MNKNKDWKSLRLWSEDDEASFDRWDMLLGWLLTTIVVILFYLIATHRPDVNDSYAPREISNQAISPEMVKFMEHEGHGQLFGEQDIE
jgi:hypothetical protein